MLMLRVFTFIILFSISLFAYANTDAKKVCIKQVCVEAEIADSAPKQAKGLMHREGLSDKEGMLFIFDKEDIYTFWMKNMQFALDIIWINQNKEIVDINTNVLPCGASCENIIPREEAKYVLEVCAGFVERNQIKIGDKVSF